MGTQPRSQGARKMRDPGNEVGRSTFKGAGSTPKQITTRCSYVGKLKSDIKPFLSITVRDKGSARVIHLAGSVLVFRNTRSGEK